MSREIERCGYNLYWTSFFENIGYESIIDEFGYDNARR